MNTLPRSAKAAMVLVVAIMCVLAVVDLKALLGSFIGIVVGIAIIKMLEAVFDDE